MGGSRVAGARGTVGALAFAQRVPAPVGPPWLSVDATVRRSPRDTDYSYSVYGAYYAEFQSAIARNGKICGLGSTWPVLISSALYDPYQLYTIAMNSPAIEQKITQSATRVAKVVFPTTINHHATLFGGTALAWMDEVSFITATRFCRKRLVTVSTERINFQHPIPSGSIVELDGRVTRVGRTSLTVSVTIFLEDMYREGREEVINGQFNFVAVDDDGRPVPLFD